jgi:hypothetical protein
VKLVFDKKHDVARLRAFDFTSEAGVRLRFWVLTFTDQDELRGFHAEVLDDQRWAKWEKALGSPFPEALHLKEPSPTTKEGEKLLWYYAFVARFPPDKPTQAFVLLAPRGIGPTAWAEPDSRDEVQMRRRYALLGQTLDSQRVWDIRRALAAMKEIPDLRTAKEDKVIEGNRHANVLALYAALMDPDPGAFELALEPDVSLSHRDGPAFLHIGRGLDIPQAVSLALPRRTTIIVNSDEASKNWQWPMQLQRALGGDSLRLRVLKVSKQP